MTADPWIAKWRDETRSQYVVHPGIYTYKERQAIAFARMYRQAWMARRRWWRRHTYVRQKVTENANT